MKQSQVLLRIEDLPGVDPEESVDPHFDPTTPNQSRLRDVVLSYAAEECQKLIDWVFHGDDTKPLRNMDGVTCRLMVLAWIFLPSFRSDTMQEIAAKAGKKKQSVGRATVSFKKHFPQFSKHIRHLRP